MKHTKLTIIATFCIAIAAFGVTAQSSRSGEGLSRQVTAIKNMLDSFADTVRPRLDDLETDMSRVIGTIDSQNTCFNRTGEPHIYWRGHPFADSNGCVAESVISSAGSDVLCNPSRPTNLLGGRKTCSECIADGGTLVDLRTAVEKQTGRPAELVCDFTGSSVRTVRSGEYDWARVSGRIERYPRPSYMASRLTCPSGYTPRTSHSRTQYHFASSRHSSSGCRPCTTGVAISHKMPSCSHETGSECGGSSTGYASTVTGIRCQ